MAQSRWLSSVTSGLIAKPEPLPVVTCFDCCEDTSVGWMSVPVYGGRHFCADCARWRTARLLEFDVRSRDVLEREVA